MTLKEVNPLKIDGYSDIGRFRKENQDAFYFDGEKCYAVIADGMGGHNGGEIASNAAVVAIRTYIDGHREQGPVELINNSISLANEIVYELGYDDLDGMGTTVVLAYIQDKTAYIGSVGDSRAYLAHGDDLKQITTDHSMVNRLLEIGKISENQVANHPQKNLLTRAVGTEKNVEIDIFEVSMAKGDTLLLCTDGLTNAISDYELIELIKAKNTPKKLCDLASKRSGKDNCTVVNIIY